ncbi:MAG: hypothetical protein RL485_1093 [Bacteroidota bacterium]|jgi:hypothetical protein
MKKVFVLAFAASALTSCTSVFWLSETQIPAQKVLNNREIEIELFDASGVRCTTAQVEIQTVNQGESAVITQFTVPKFTSEKRRATKLNYLWMVDGQDTTVYELAYRSRTSVASFTALGGALVLSGIPVAIVADDSWTGAIIAYFGLVTSVYGGILIDMPTGIAGLIKESKANSNGLNPRWKLKGVRKLTPSEYPAAVIRGIEALGNEVPKDKPSDTPYGKRITQP